MTTPEPIINRPSSLEMSPTERQALFNRLTLLRALPVLGKHVYSGTVPPAEVQKRRAKNRRARAQRKINRRRSN